MGVVDFYCVSCKKVIPEDATCCPFCGADQTYPGYARKAQSQNITLRLPKPRRSRQSQNWEITLTALLLLAILIGVGLNHTPVSFPSGYREPLKGKRFLPPVLPPPSGIQPNASQPSNAPPTPPSSNPSADTNVPQPPTGANNPPASTNPSPLPLNLPVPIPDMGTVKITDAEINFVGDTIGDDIMAAGRVTITNTTNHYVQSVKLIIGDYFGPELVPFEGTVDNPSPIFDTSIPPQSSESFPVMTTGEFSGMLYGPHKISMEADMDNGTIISDSDILD
jgi:hypothetical protein